MTSRADLLLQALGLVAHPEGGAYREVFRSPHRVTVPDGGERSALTTIYFLLGAGQKSRWHRVDSDEVWHFYDGDPLELMWIDAEFSRLERRMLGPVSITAAPHATPAREPVAVVPAGGWQAARSLGAHTLAGCSMGPGFEFDAFTLMNDVPEAVTRLRARFPELAEFV